MSLSNKKFLISGCGISWGSQARPTWVKILRCIGLRLVDVGGPAVSNQWIINQTILALQQSSDYHAVFVQLTALGKLDVEIDSDEKKSELVDSDSLRNFVVDGVWPSSHSQEHVSKQIWNKWLYSPKLEQQDIVSKLFLLKEYCCAREIPLQVIQGYNIDWMPEYQPIASSIIDNIDKNCYAHYMQSIHWQEHDYSNQNLVPHIGYQLELAENFVKAHAPEYLSRLEKMATAIK